MQLNIFFAVLTAVFFICAKTSFAAPIEILDARATPEYWIKRAENGDQILLDAAEIENLNAFLLERDPYSANLEIFPETVSGEDLSAKILRISGDVDVSGNFFTMNNRNLDKIPAEVQTRYAVTVERADLRLVPQPFTGDRYDAFQGTAVDPAEAVAVLWESADGKFVFAQTRNYFGWIAKTAVAFTDRDTWLNYARPENFLVVTDNKKYLSFKGKKILFQMGAKIPLVTATKKNNFWTARIPTSKNGSLREVHLRIYDDDKINLGWLDCTTNNFIRQAFKFRGDVYGWGGLDNSVDCSAFVGDVYRSMGIEIPRDANRQEGAMPIVAVFNDVTRRERKDIVKRSPVGALLFKPGHVMLKLGNDDKGTPIVIHAASSYMSDGQKIYVRKVLVSDLSYVGGTVPTLEALTGIAFVK